MRPVRRRSVIVGTLLLVITGCGSMSGDSTPTPPPASPPAVGRPVPASPVPSLMVGSEGSPQAQGAAVEGALSDAAAQLGISRDQLHVDRTEAREWSDSSLGCPRPGLQYLQVVTPGFLVVLSGAGKQLEYHADSRGRVVLCQPG